jgi:C4-dicarboxylate-specific signal transduction histidine kinase
MALPLGCFSAGIAHDSNRMSKEAPMATLSKAGLHSKPLTVSSSDRSDMARIQCLEVLAACIVNELDQSLPAVALNADACVRMLSPHRLNLEGARDKALRTMQSATRATAAMRRLWSLFAKTDASDESVDLNEVVREVLALLVQELQLRRVSVRQELAADLPRIAGDPYQLQQALLNLVENAAEAMNEVHDRHRELVVTTRSGDGHVRLSVRDAGAGFKSGDSHRLFDPFYTTKRDGLGIGLFISRWIIENHRGSLCAALNDGPGATFSLSIPFGPA